MEVDIVSLSSQNPSCPQLPVRYRPANLVATWLLAGVVAALPIAGTSWHSILGIHHGLGCCESADHAFSAGGPRPVAVDRANSGGNGVCNEENCPICSFLTQAQIAGEYAAVVVCSLRVENDNVALPISIPAADFPAFDARGPPAA